jgi:hypothetical protein
MSIDEIKIFWRSRSTRAKWVIGGVAALVLVGIGNSGDRPNRVAGYQTDRMAGTMGSGCAAGYTGCGMPDRGTGTARTMGFGGTNPGQSGPGELTSDWDQRQASQDRAARGFSQYVRGQTDIQATRDGQITTDVPNEAADPAVASGAYSAAPPTAIDSPPAAEGN